MRKKCNTCLKALPLELFHKSSKTKDGFGYSCKNCKSFLDKQYYGLNSDRVKNRIKKQYEKTPERFRSRSSKFRLENVEKIKQWRQRYHFLNPTKKLEWYAAERSKRKSNPVKRLGHRISCLVRISLKKQMVIKSEKTIGILGCTILDFKKYIESKWEPWMNWTNYGLYNGEEKFGWDLDHIIPFSLAQNETEAIALNYYTNFQPLCSKINRVIKKNRV